MSDCDWLGRQLDERGIGGKGEEIGGEGGEKEGGGVENDEEDAKVKREKKINDAGEEEKGEGE